MLQWLREPGGIGIYDAPTAPGAAAMVHRRCEEEVLRSSSRGPLQRPAHHRRHRARDQAPLPTTRPYPDDACRTPQAHRPHEKVYETLTTCRPYIQRFDVGLRFASPVHGYRPRGGLLPDAHHAAAHRLTRTAEANTSQRDRRRLCAASECASSTRGRWRLQKSAPSSTRPSGPAHAAQVDTAAPMAPRRFPLRQLY